MIMNMVVADHSPVQATYRSTSKMKFMEASI